MLDCVPDEGFHPVSHQIEPEMIDDPLACTRPHRGTPRWIGQQTDDRGGIRGGFIARRRDKDAAVGGDEFALPANIGCNRDDSHCHGFVEHYCDSFTRRGQEQEIGGCQRLAHPLWGKRPGQLNIAQHWIAQHTFQHRTFRTFADDQRTERNTALRNIAQDSHDQTRLLLWHKTPDKEDQGAN